MSLPPGTRLGPYEIVAPLGAGGMGEVFRARDTRLGRTVAIKVLRQELAGFADGRARFEREARTIASLAHPHICTLHDVGEADIPSAGKIQFLVMELLEGETLAERLARGPLSLDDTLAYAIQIAGALDRAHAQGIVHRDLKPGNIMLARSDASRQGSPQVKLLDFGLAQLRPEQPPGAADITQLAPPATQGVALGTLPYMAPEQLEGKDADARTDLFAFGAVVYEMAAGRRAFDAPSQAGLIGAILRSDPPPIAAVNPAAPPALDRLVKTCLAKDADERWSSAHDVLLVLRDIVADAKSGAPPQSIARSGRRERVAWMSAAGAVIAAAILAGRILWPQAEVSVDVVSVLPPAGTAVTVGEAPQVSPDGRHVAFAATDTSGKTLLYVRTRSSGNARALPDTEDATLPFWSPDSRQLGFFTRGELKTVSLSGGRPQTLASAPVPRGGAWSREGDILFVPFPNESPLLIPASAGNTAPVPVPGPPGERRWFPSFLPDGRHYVYLGWNAPRSKAAAIRVASLDSTDIKDLFPSKTSAVFAEPGYLIFRRESALVAQRLDVRRLELQGAPIVLAENVGFNPISYQGFFSAANAGMLAYLEPDPGGHLTWFDRLGRRLGTLLEAGHYNSLCITPDGTRILYDSADGATGDVDIWSVDLTRGTQTRLTFDPAVDFYPVCAPSANEVVFTSARLGRLSMFRQVISAPGSEEELPQPPGPKGTTDWSRDGRLIVYSAYDPKTSWDIWVLTLTGGQPYAFAVTTAEERNGRLSPDGRWMAYTLQVGAAIDVYVQPFPATGAKWQVSHGGGRQQVWRADGRELFYMTLDSKLVAVEVASSQSSFTVGPPHVIVETRVAGWERTNQGTPFAVTPDGQRFLVSTASDTVMPITLVLNWPGMLKK